MIRCDIGFCDTKFDVMVLLNVFLFVFVLECWAEF
jgi:hypothetical protein